MAKKTSKPEPMAPGHTDDIQTPPYGLLPLLPYLDENWRIWEPAAGKGNMVKGLEALGWNVVGTDILTGKDFLTCNPPKFDCIVTNPPYSLKKEFLERCYGYNKPFALLLPLTALETEDRQSLFRKYGLKMVLFNPRIDFEMPDGGSSSWFATAWYTWKLPVPHQLTFVKLEKPYAEKKGRNRNRRNVAGD